MERSTDATSAALHRIITTNTPTATCFEQFNFSSEEFLSMVRFDQRSKLEELQEKIDRTGQDDR
jgi:hypothetical protein